MRLLFPFRIVIFLFCASNNVAGQGLPSPKQHFGFEIGDDYQLATFTQTEAFFKKIAAVSDRVRLVSIGKTEEGRDQPMLIVTSPENHKKLDRLKQISVQMARAENLSEKMAEELANEGKAVVWIDGGLHSNETVGTHQLIETFWQLVSRNDKETNRILDQVVVLFVHANPDGQELVSNWYMRQEDPRKRSLQNLPVLYQKYAGHDNNRDFYMFNLKESQNIGRQLFVDWIPQIMYNHHQRGPAGTVLAGPPYRDPFNYLFDPMVITGIDAIGATMYNRLNAENKPGFTRLGGSVFSTWYNGGLRTSTYFHNMIGILTELAGGPTPETIALVPDRLIPDNNTPNPVGPQKWHFRQSIDYSVSLNYAVLDYAARHSDELLMNIYRMGRNSIDRGKSDFWTPYPKRIQEIKDVQSKKMLKGGALPFRSTVPAMLYDSVFRVMPERDPRGYIISAAQNDFSTAVKFVNTLLRSGIRVERASADFQVAGKSFPRGSFVVKTDQAFRPHVLDMFEAQNYPNDFAFPGGPPIAPYDAAGWTLAYQMGVDFERFSDDFQGPFTTIPYGEMQKPESSAAAEKGGYLLNPSVNDSFLAVNLLLKRGVAVYRLETNMEKNLGGSFYVPETKSSRVAMDEIQRDLGTNFPRKTLARKAYHLEPIKSPLRIGLIDVYGGSMPSGWIRWILEQFQFEFKVVYPREIDAGNLIDKYDVLILPTRSVPTMGSLEPRGINEEDVPPGDRHRIGTIGTRQSIPSMKSFLEAGGRVVAIGSSANLAYHLQLPVGNMLTEVMNDGSRRDLPSEKFYIPGSILRVLVDTAQISNAGFRSQTDVYFEKSPVFVIAPEALASGLVKPLAWYGSTPLRSGWAWGQSYLTNGIAAFEAGVGKGKLVVFGPEITFRGQSHGTFRWLFNQLY